VVHNSIFIDNLPVFKKQVPYQSAEG